MKIPSGVTLVLPYGNASDATGRNQSGTATETGTDGRVANTILGSDNKPTYERTRVVLCEGVVLIVDGTLEINGKISSKSSGTGNDAAGYTAKDYATLRLEKGAKVEIYGSALIYGFIENVDGNSDSLVTVFNDGNLYLPFTLRDFKGGTILSAIKEGMDAGKGYAPFHQFYFPNICAKLRINYGGNLRTWCNLYSNNKHNFTEGHMVGKVAGALLQLTDPTYSYLEATYNRDTQITDLNIYGGARLNSMSLTVNVLGKDVTVTSSDFIFGLSWLYDISLDNNDSGIGNDGKVIAKQDYASFIMPDGYKLLPGGKLTIEQGATLTITTFTIYSASDFDDVLTGEYPGTGVYPDVYPASSSLSGVALADGYLLVSGNLNVTNIGGNVYADSEGATITVSGNMSMTTWEPTCVEKGLLTGSVTDAQSITTVLKLLYVIGNPDIYGLSDEQNQEKDNSVDSIEQNKEYISDAEYETWHRNVAMVPITLRPGTSVEFGGTKYTAEGEDLLVLIENDTEVTFTLTKNYLLVTGGVSTFEISDPSHGIYGISSLYTLTTTVKASDIPKICYVPSITLNNGSGVKCIVYYYNLNDSNSAESSTAYAQIVFTVSGDFKNSGSLKLTVTGIEKTFSDSNVVDDTCTVTGSNKNASITATTIEIHSNHLETITTVKEFNEGSCVTPDTLITLADGTQVRVDSLTGDEMLLVWNLETGTWDYAPIMFVDSELEAEFEIIYLHFSDGTVVKVIYEHGFWDYDLNKYVYLDANAADYIGHYFAKQNGDELVKVQLVDVEIKTELTTAWSPVTVGHLCYFVNGMLSMPGGVGGLFNIFEVDEETMTYDYEAIAKDIETYGLFTYEELNAICPLSEAMFDAAGGAYLKISIGKGNLTMDELIYMINRYSVYFE